MITVRLLGTPCLRSGETVLGGPPAQRHRIALLALIADAWPQPLARDRALALLWPERDEAAARRLLNLAVHVLRTALGEAAIVTRGDGLLLDPAHVDCDLQALRAAIAAGDPERIAALHVAPLLDGFHLPESAEFEQWLDRRRDELGHAHVRALTQIADARERAGDTPGLVEACRRLVAAEPYSSEHALRLMRALDAAGDRAAALEHFAEYARRLRADLEVEPDPEVTAFADELRRGPLPSVAVLPFVDLDGDPAPGRGNFADGVTEEVIAHLAKIRSLKVIARSSVTAYRDRREPLREIGRALGVGAVLDGSVRHAGDRVRIVAALVDVRTGRQLWAETYDRELTDIFAIQTDVALRIAEALQAELSAEERGRVHRAATRDIQAYRLYLQARQAMIQFTPEGLERAVEYFERAIARDPNFALAYAQLAMACIEQAEQAATPPKPMYERATAAVARALELEPELSEAHATAGYLKMVYEFDWEAAERGLRRAIELSPGSGYAYDLLARLCWSIERYDEAIPLGRRAQELDPAANRMDMCTMLLRAGRYEEALVHAQNAVEVEPTAGRARATLGWAYFLTGRREEGIRELEIAVECTGRNTLWLGQLGEALGMIGRTDRAREIIRELEERSRRGFVSPYHFAYVYTGLGEYDRTGQTYSIKGSFLFRPLRGHPRWKALMRTMNLE